MITISICLLALAQAPTDKPPDAVAAYLARCEAAKVARIQTLREAIAALEVELPSPATGARLEQLRGELAALNAAPASLLPLALPCRRGELGILPELDAAAAATSNTAPRQAGQIDVLEIIDPESAIVRLWYLPVADRSTLEVPGTATFVDLWVRGVETARWQVGQPAELLQVFHVEGPQSLPTTCGSRSFVQLRPVAIQR